MQKIDISILVAITALLLIGCSKKEKNYNEGLAAEDKYVESRFYRLFNDSLKREDVSDPELWKQDRIQLSLKDKYSKKTTIWSMKIDGTDLRLVLDSTELYGNTYLLGYSRTPVRSPDRRWLALSGTLDINPEKRFSALFLFGW